MQRARREHRADVVRLAVADDRLARSDADAHEARWRRVGGNAHGVVTQYREMRWLLPFNSIGARSSSGGGSRSARRKSSERRISPPSAAEQSRLAVLTVSPMTVNSSRRSEPMFPANASPKLRPMPMESCGRPSFRQRVFNSSS